MTDSTPLIRKPLFWATGIALAAVGGYLLFGVQRKPSGKSMLKSPAAYAINADKFTPLKLTSVEDVSHNTKKYRFGFEDPQALLGMDVASCLLVKADAPVKSRETGEIAIKPVIRPYTPVSERNQKGYVDLVIKTYPDGAMSQHMAHMKVGDTLLFKGPLQKIEYEANKWKHIGMLAGGTGLTPMLQVIKEILGNPTDKTKVSLMYANVSGKDILLKDALDKLAAQHPDQLKVYYTIDKKEPGWNHFVGYIDKDKYQKAQLPKVEEEAAIVFVCGPPGFMKAFSGDKNKDKSQGEVDPSSLLGKMGFKSDKVFKF